VSPRVLIVEDETIVRLHLRRILSDLGCEVTDAVATADDAIASVAAVRPALVLMDVRLAGERDGIDVARELRDRFDLNCVFVTAYADQETIRRVQEVGALGYLVKPFDRSEVAAAVATALTQSVHLERLQGRSRSLAAMLENSSDAALVLDDVGRVTALNSHAALLAGRLHEEAIDRPVAEVLRIHAGGTEAWRNLLEHPAAARMEVVSADGRRHDVEIQVTPLHERSKSHHGSYVVLKKSLPASAPDLTLVPGLDGQDITQFHGIVGSSAAMLRVYQQIRDLASVDWNVLVDGETGAGKDLVAHAIHATSTRHEGPFVAVNCAGLSDSLLASQLFGHRKGAFTGAVRDHEGLFEMANRGTLFLDEVGDVSMTVQKTLLRVLEDKKVTRLGDSRERQVNVRLVASTQHDLIAQVEKGHFRADLLYRLRVARVSLPPLRSRGNDVLHLAQWFLRRSRALAGKSIQDFAESVEQRLLDYSWPGNVRELRSAIEFAVLACRGPRIELEHLPPEIVIAPGRIEGHADEQQRILAALERTGGNRTQAARLVGISRATFYRRLGELGITPH